MSQFSEYLKTEDFTVLHEMMNLFRVSHMLMLSCVEPGYYYYYYYYYYLLQFIPRKSHVNAILCRASLLLLLLLLLLLFTVIKFSLIGSSPYTSNK